MALAADNASDRAEQMITLSDRLTGLLQRETKLFEQRTPQLASEFADEKGSLARIYRNETARIAKNPALLASADANLKADLREATLRFNQALAANHKATTAIRTITQGMVHSVANEVAKTRASQTGYGVTGTNTASNTAMSAITLDQRV
ncbi:hypothetical protein MNBD_ALPHA06-1889 [hydrothermal vent metagenome]|uniref:Flagellar basal-body protein FlbY n=1 Tax=hydrothermal vent metagenome TaxID=652676 RepID=A0A3B0S771_9ZZZZ